jgi:hypothetical protein
MRSPWVPLFKPMENRCASRSFLFQPKPMTSQPLKRN